LDKVRERHQDYFLRFAREADLYGSEQERAVERLDKEYDNLRAVLEWGQKEEQAAEAALEMASLLWRFWWIRGHFAEGGAHLAALLAGAEGRGRTALRAWGLYAAGVLAREHGDYAAARPLYEESLAIRRELGQDRNAGAASVLQSLGNVLRLQGE